MFISNKLYYSVIFVGNNSFECIFVSLTYSSCKFCVCLLYRPPSHTSDVLNSLYDTLFSLNTSLFTNFILVGDFNIDLCNHNSTLYSKLVSVTSTFFVYQVIKEPTRHVPSGSSSTIDLCIYLSRH